jgi:hypothetical protein
MRLERDRTTIAVNERTSMKIPNSIRKFTVRSSTALGVALIAASVIGTVTVIRINNVGSPVVLAREFIAAGTVITDDMLVDARVVGTNGGAPLRTDVVGRVLGIDVGPGEIVAARSLDETGATGTIVAIPLGVTPARALTAGQSITLWEVDGDGLVPPVAIANRATLIEVTDGSMGAETQATVLLDGKDIDRVLGAIGSTDLIVATSGQTP